MEIIIGIIIIGLIVWMFKELGKVKHKPEDYYNPAVDDKKARRKVAEAEKERKNRGFEHAHVVQKQSPSVTETMYANALHTMNKAIDPTTPKHERPDEYQLKVAQMILSNNPGKSMPGKQHPQDKGMSAMGAGLAGAALGAGGVALANAAMADDAVDEVASGVEEGASNILDLF